jgi:hypothetical protein
VGRGAGCCRPVKTVRAPACVGLGLTRLLRPEASRVRSPADEPLLSRLSTAFFFLLTLPLLPLLPLLLLIICSNKRTHAHHTSTLSLSSSVSCLGQHCTTFCSAVRTTTRRIDRPSSNASRLLCTTTCATLLPTSVVDHRLTFSRTSHLVLFASRRLLSLSLSLLLSSPLPLSSTGRAVRLLKISVLTLSSAFSLSLSLSLSLIRLHQLLHPTPSRGPSSSSTLPNPLVCLLYSIQKGAFGIQKSN